MWPSAKSEHHCTNPASSLASSVDRAELTSHLPTQHQNHSLAKKCVVVVSMLQLSSQNPKSRSKLIVNTSSLEPQARFQYNWLESFNASTGLHLSSDFFLVLSPCSQIPVNMVSIMSLVLPRKMAKITFYLLIFMTQIWNEWTLLNLNAQ